VTNEPLVLEEDTGPVRQLTLNRPHVLNALSAALVEDLSAALARAAADDRARVVVLRGAGRAFCVGYDLKEEAEHHAQRGPLDVAAWREELAHDVGRMLEIFDHPKPVIAQVHGYCLAGGCDLMMMSDLAVAADDALRIGLVNRVVPKERLEEETLALARKVAVMDPVALSLTKRSINRSLEVAGFREALAANVDLDAIIETAEVPERREFNRIREEQGLKTAIRWRDERFR
jgi:enoyl-CoA hydratase